MQSIADFLNAHPSAVIIIALVLLYLLALYIRVQLEKLDQEQADALEQQTRRTMTALDNAINPPMTQAQMDAINAERNYWV